MIYEDKGTSLFGGRGYKLENPPHLHNAAEVAWIQKGTAVLQVDGVAYTLSPGDAFMLFPNQIHAYRSVGPETYLLYVIPVQMLAPFKDVFAEYVPENPVLRADAQMAFCFAQLEQELLKKSPYGENMQGAYALLLAGYMLRNLRLQKRQPAAGLVQRVTAFCLANLHRPLSLSILSEELHISKSHLSHLFVERMGISFTKYIHRLRVNEACARLKTTEEKIIDIAFAAGFSDVRTFNRVFLRYTGLSPGQYRKLNK